MFNRLKQSVAFRSGSFYRKVCNLLPNPTYIPGPVAPFRFLSMTGSKHLDMLNQCLISLHNTWYARPDLIIYSDGTVSLQALKRKLNWWKGNIKFGTQEEILAWTAQSGSQALHSFACKEAVGRKLSCILLEATDAPVLWCDTDILWYKQIGKIENLKEFQLQVSEDYQAAYDGYISEKCPEILLNPPFINTGLVYLQGHLLNELPLIPWLNELDKKPNHFTEQTFLAIAVKLLKGKMWSLNEIACLQSDRFKLSPSFKGKNWIARHYVGPVRHLFWRDAFFTRITPSK
jgi:hypothetical protein